MTTPPRPGRDSLILAGSIELLGGGVPSTHPSCPGAVFRLAPGYDEGAPQPSADVVTKMLTGGSRPHGRWADNRAVKLPVIILAPDRATLVAARELLAQLLDADEFETRWHRDGAPGPMVLDCYRAGAAAPGYSVLEERENLARIEVSFAALPYGRSDVRETVWFPSPIVGAIPAPVYRPWEQVDPYTTVASVTQPGSWGRALRPGSGAFPGSAHWNPLAGANTPVYHRVLPGNVDITGRQQISLWVGLGNSNGQWRSGNLTFRVTLYDTGMSWLQFGGTFKLTASDNWNAPSFTRIAMTFPTTTGFHFEELREYFIEVPNFTNAAKMGDLYLNCMGASPDAVPWPAPSARGTVYSVAGAGTARAPVSLRFQPPEGSYSQSRAWTAASEAVNWLSPPGVMSPDGTPDTVQARVWGAAGAGSTMTNANAPHYGIGGGAAAGGCAGDDHFPAPPGVTLTGIVGAGPPGATAQPPAGAASTLTSPAPGGYELRATGGPSAPNNSYNQGGTPGSGQLPAPIRYSGGRGTYGRTAGNPGQGAGGGGGGAGSSGPGKDAPGQPGGEGGPGGGHGGGGRSPFDHGPGSPGGGPAGGGGGATWKAGGAALGGKGANGRVEVNWLVPAVPMQTLMVHMPGPETHATFAPVIALGGTASQPLGTTFYPAASPQPGMPVRYDGTYSAVLVASSWANATVARDIEVKIIQFDRDLGANPPIPGATTRTAAVQVVGGAIYHDLIPAHDAIVQAGFLVLGTVTLPLRQLPADNQSAVFGVTVRSTQTGDRFLDLALLDVTGQTVIIADDGGGFTNYFIDEPDASAGLGNILGSDYGRTQARSVTELLGPVSGGPFILEPGQGNLLLAYSKGGSPSLGLDYYSRWWFDRADDLAASGVGGAPPNPRAWLNGQPVPGPPPPASVLAAAEAGR